VVTRGVHDTEVGQASAGNEPSSGRLEAEASDHSDRAQRKKGFGYFARQDRDEKMTKS